MAALNIAGIIAKGAKAAKAAKAARGAKAAKAAASGGKRFGRKAGVDPTMMGDLGIMARATGRGAKKGAELGAKAGRGGARAATYGAQKAYGAGSISAEVARSYPLVKPIAAGVMASAVWNATAPPHADLNNPTNYEQSLQKFAGLSPEQRLGSAVSHYARAGEFGVSGQGDTVRHSLRRALDLPNDDMVEQGLVEQGLSMFRDSPQAVADAIGASGPMEGWGPEAFIRLAQLAAKYTAQGADVAPGDII